MNTTEFRIRMIGAVQAMLLEPGRRNSMLADLHEELVLCDKQPVDVGDIIYVRHGPHGVRLAIVKELGAGANESCYRVRVWSTDGERFMSLRWISALDFRGFPDDRQAAQLKKEDARVTD